MTALPRTGPSLSWRLLTDGIPLSLLLDLHDPEGMRAALAGELTASDVARAGSGTVGKPIRRSA